MATDYSSDYQKAYGVKQNEFTVDRQQSGDIASNAKDISVLEAATVVNGARAQVALDKARNVDAKMIASEKKWKESFAVMKNNTADLAKKLTESFNAMKLSTEQRFGKVAASITKAEIKIAQGDRTIMDVVRALSTRVTNIDIREIAQTRMEAQRLVDLGLMSSGLGFKDDLYRGMIHYGPLHFTPSQLFLFIMEHVTAQFVVVQKPMSSLSPATGTPSALGSLSTISTYLTDLLQAEGQSEVMSGLNSKTGGHTIAVAAGDAFTFDFAVNNTAAIVDCVVQARGTTAGFSQYKMTGIEIEAARVAGTAVTLHDGILEGATCTPNAAGTVLAFSFPLCAGAETYAAGVVGVSITERRVGRIAKKFSRASIGNIISSGVVGALVSKERGGAYLLGELLWPLIGGYLGMEHAGGLLGAKTTEVASPANVKV